MTRQGSGPQPVPNPKSLVEERPLPGAECTTARGRRVSGDFIDKNNRATRTAHQRMCGRCPVRDECRNWVLRAEPTPGVWAGMYGGLTQDERVQVGRMRSLRAASSS